MARPADGAGLCLAAGLWRACGLLRGRCAGSDGPWPASGDEDDDGEGGKGDRDEAPHFERLPPPVTRRFSHSSTQSLEVAFDPDAKLPTTISMSPSRSKSPTSSVV